MGGGLARSATIVEELGWADISQHSQSRYGRETDDGTYAQDLSPLL